MLVFIKNDKGRPEAMEGEHDDTVMALAIAHYAKSQVIFAQEPIIINPIDEFGFGDEFTSDRGRGSKMIRV